MCHLLSPNCPEQSWQLLKMLAVEKEPMGKLAILLETLFWRNTCLRMQRFSPDVIQIHATNNHGLVLSFPKRTHICFTILALNRACDEPKGCMPRRIRTTQEWAQKVIQGKDKKEKKDKTKDKKDKKDPAPCCQACIFLNVRHARRKTRRRTGRICRHNICVSDCHGQTWMAAAAFVFNSTCRLQTMSFSFVAWD